MMRFILNIDTKFMLYWFCFFFLFICRQESKETSKHSPCIPNQSCPPPCPRPQSPAQSSTPCQRPQGEEEHIFTSRGAPQAAEGCRRCNSSQEVQDKLMKWVVGSLQYYSLYRPRHFKRLILVASSHIPPFVWYAHQIRVFVSVNGC